MKGATEEETIIHLIAIILFGAAFLTNIIFNLIK